MKLDKIKEKIDPFLNELMNNITLMEASAPKGKQNIGKYIQLISLKLRTIFCDNKNNPTFRYDEAMQFYFNDKKGLKNISDKYKLIVELQNYICEKTNIPFIYDKFLILKILQITLYTYNNIINNSKNKVCMIDNNELNEDISNIFIEIDSMLLNDRNTSAENNNSNAKAIDNVNRYKTENGGFGVKIEKDKTENEKKNFIVVTAEETKKKLGTRFNFSELLNSNNKKSEGN